MTTHKPATDEETQIRQLIDEQINAICAKDMDRLMKLYAEDFTAFDAKPPFQINGPDAWRKTWAACLPYFPASFGIETRDLRISAGSDMAIAHWLCHITSAEDHPATQMWMRSTIAYRRTQDKWQIIHEHWSVPLDPETSQAVFTPES
jgi:uncharacterized protein (TIGR02246 family)